MWPETHSRYIPIVRYKYEYVMNGVSGGENNKAHSMGALSQKP